MRNHFKFQIILCINFLLLIPLNLKAQKEYTPKQNLKNHMENSLKFEKYSFTKLRFSANQQDGIQRKYHLPVFNRSQIIEDCPEQPDMLSEVIPLTVNKKQLTRDVLDSVIYTQRGWKYKESFTNDEKAIRLAHLKQYWDTPTSDWVNEWRRTYTHDDSGNLQTTLYERWDSNAGIWIYNFRNTYTYDGSGNVLTSIGEDWDSNAGIWLNSSRGTYSYDSRGNLIHFIFEEWSGSGWFAAVGSCWLYNVGFCWLYNNEYNYSFDCHCEELSAYYSLITDIDNVDNNVICSFSLSQNYPNPFNPSTKIKFALPKPETVTIEVYNIIGQKIETILNKPMPAGYHEVEFNSQNLSSGIYLYRIEAGGWSDVKKMVLLQ